jgi:hypothetical protein
MTDTTVRPEATTGTGSTSVVEKTVLPDAVATAYSGG